MEIITWECQNWVSAGKMEVRFSRKEPIRQYLRQQKVRAELKRKLTPMGSDNYLTFIFKKFNISNCI